MPTNQFADQQKRLNSRLDRFNTISKLLSSKSKADRQNAQRKLKAIGRYNGPIDGNQGKGTTAALRAMRGTIDTDQAKLDKRVDSFNATAAQKRKDAAKKRADKQADNARKDSNALYQGAFNAGALAVSSAVVKVQVSALNKLDAPAVASKNKELARFTKEIDKIKSEPGAKTKSKALKAATKRRIGAVADKASKAGVTKYRAPIGLTGGGLLFAKGVVLKYAATQTDNELLKGTLDATGNGLMLAGAGTPAVRFTRNAFGANQLNGTHLAKIADAKAIAAPVKKKVKASVNTKAIKGAGVVGKGVSKAIPVLGWGLAAYAIGEAAYSKFSKTGSAAKAASAGAEAGVDVLTSGAYSVTKNQAKSFYKQSPNVLVNKGLSGYAKHYAPHNVVLRTALSVIPKKHLPATGKKILSDAKVATGTPTIKRKSISVQGALSKSKTKIGTKAKSARRAAKVVKRAGATFKRTRVVNGKTIHETVRNTRRKR